MRILVTNDDGIHSPGLWSVAGALQDLGEIIVVAPDRDHSGIGTARTLLAVVRAQEIDAPVKGISAFSIQGTPADCVILACEMLVKEPFDLVVSGINQGANLGLDILDSGTVGAAFQGYLRDIPSIAVSVVALVNVQNETGAKAASALVRAMPNVDLPTPFLLNLNIPNLALDKVGQMAITKVGPRPFLESVERGNDGCRTHYWIKHNKTSNVQVQEGTDVWAVRNGRISITPLDLTFGQADMSHDWTELADKANKNLELDRLAGLTG